MNAPQAFYAKQGNTYVLKLVGNVRYTMGCSLDEFLDHLFEQENYDDILVDLTEAIGIDSTCLGLLAKIANFMRQRFNSKTTLISTNEDVNQILDSVGFYEIFTICDNRAEATQAMQGLPLLDLDQEALAKTILESHCLLSELNETNQASFKNVIEALKNRVTEKS